MSKNLGEVLFLRPRWICELQYIVCNKLNELKIKVYYNFFIDKTNMTYLSLMTIWPT